MSTTAARPPPSPLLERCREWAPVRPTDLRLTLGPLRHGSGDPSHQHAADGSVWRAQRTPDGPATLHLRTTTSGAVAARAWGRGADWALASVPALLGDGDPHETASLAADHRLLRDPARRWAGWRVCRSGLVWESLVPVILEQKVTGIEAKASWRRLLLRFGEPAPGPAGAGAHGLPPLRLIPDAATWAQLPFWEWHRAGVGPERMRVIARAAAVAGRLEETAAMAPPDAARRLGAVPGIGVWTVAEVRQRAHGDPDAVSFGDFHVAKDVTWALTGRVGDDADLERVLEPWRGQRYRVCTLLALAGLRRPRRGPRLAPLDHRAH